MLVGLLLLLAALVDDHLVVLAAKHLLAIVVWYLRTEVAHGRKHQSGGTGRRRRCEAVCVSLRVCARRQCEARYGDACDASRGVAVRAKEAELLQLALRQRIDQPMGAAASNCCGGRGAGAQASFVASSVGAELRGASRGSLGGAVS